ncbi:MAG: DUF402 domain-containing protein [Anaerolineae bacterium]|nr:DUF402 domain-containing protein [Anaerolineae bacterium]
MGESVILRKLDLEGREVWRWRGEVVARGENWVQIEAPFNGKRRDLGYVVLQEGDRFVEWYYADRWYNIFEIHDAADDRIKGWYCNIARPAVFRDGEITHVDLALDLFVFPDGRMLLDDEEEFAALPLSEVDRRAALDAVARLRAEVESRRPPFDAIPQQGR